jgi:hypothetical protein
MFGLFAAGVGTMRVGWVDGRLTAAGRDVFRALAPAVLPPALLADATGLSRASVLDDHLARVEQTVSAMPPHLQAEVAELLLVLIAPAGRRLLFGMASPWQEASVDEVSTALVSLRESSFVTRQQVYHALRDITAASFFAAASAQTHIGYSGQRPVEVS